MYKITSYFGQQESFRLKPHSGCDLKMKIGEPIRSIKDGTIRLADYGNINSGKTVFVEWEDGKTAIYGHLSEFAVKNGQHVNAGDLIGYAGNTGFSTGSHLHFGIKKGNEYLDPSPYIDDIQHMNDVNYFAKHQSEVVNLKITFFDYMQQHMNGLSDSLNELKLNLISSLTNDIVVIQILEQLFQFISIHTSFLNHIIACIV